MGGSVVWLIVERAVDRVVYLDPADCSSPVPACSDRESTDLGCARQLLKCKKQSQDSPRCIAISNRTSDFELHVVAASPWLAGWPASSSLAAQEDRWVGEEGRSRRFKSRPASVQANYTVDH